MGASLLFLGRRRRLARMRTQGGLRFAIMGFVKVQAWDAECFT